MASKSKEQLREEAERELAELNSQESDDYEKLKVHSVKAGIGQATMDSVDAQDKRMVLMTGKIKLDELHDGPDRARYLSKEDYERLKNNLANNPLANPITVRYRKEGGYEIISGHNRVKIYRELGKLEIESRVMKFDDDTDVEGSAFYSNLINSDLTAYEKYQGLVKIAKAKNLKTSTEIAKQVGISRQQVDFLFAFEKLPESILKILDQHRHILGYRSARILTQKGLEISEEKMIGVFQRLAAGLVSEVKAVEELLNVPKKYKTAILDNKGNAYAYIDRKENKLAIDFKNGNVNDQLFEEVVAIIEKYKQNATL
jgi:ParB family chromosome partitioning protein